MNLMGFFLLPIFGGLIKAVREGLLGLDIILDITDSL